MWFTRGPLAPDELTRRFWWRFHRKEAIAGFLAALVIGGVVVTSLLFVDETDACNDGPFECNLLTEVAGTLAVAGAGVLFFAWKLRKIVKDFAREARERPEALLGVEMPPRVAGEMRYEQLFHVIARDLMREQPARSGNGAPNGHTHPADGSANGHGALVPGKLIVGGAGTGKTTAMVLLTAFLAERQAVPVPVGLRSQPYPINLVQLARDQFKDRAETRTLFGDQGDRVFARLRGRGQVVILADGLDEAMPESSRSQREVALSAAVQDALAAGVAVVATWRTAQLGQDLPLTRFDLPELDDEDVVGYLCPPGEDQDSPDALVDAELAKTIVAAELKETPFYLTIAQPLLDTGRLDTWRGDDVVTLRVALLDRYVAALCDSEAPLLPAADVPIEERVPIVDDLSNLACAMVVHGRASVPVADVEKWADAPFGQALQSSANAHRVVEGGRALQLFELVSQETGQFTHSVMQSYLASRRIREHTGKIGGLVERTPCDELITSIVMAGAWRADGEDEVARQARGRRVADTLLEKSETVNEHLGLALVTAATKIAMACGLSDALGDTIVARAKACWDAADTAARLDAIGALAALDTGRAFALLRSALDDRQFTVRLAAAQALGEAGEPSYRMLKTELEEALPEEGTCDQRALDRLGYLLPLLRSDGEKGYVPEVARLIRMFEAGLEPGVEATAARGFKRDAFVHPERTVQLEDLEAVLNGARWWYSKLCLLHAITLRADGTNGDRARKIIQATADAPGQDEFVVEGTRQCLLALDSGDIERWVWRDEPEVVSHARPTRRRSVAAEEGLAVEAVQLAADVALAMNLTLSLPTRPNDREERREERDRRARKWIDEKELPYCLAKSRDRREVFPPDGQCHGDCPYDFCPLGSTSAAFWSEFSEAFCRQQQEALPRRDMRPSWQRGFRRKRGLRSFWEAMADEARKASSARTPGRR
jgi:hypothetical protein